MTVKRVEIDIDKGHTSVYTLEGRAFCWAEGAWAGQEPPADVLAALTALWARQPRSSKPKRRRTPAKK